jgi:NAD(P)-dependent dehydrogenase (short-subunit alcohol dehydrogenase family)
MLQQGAEALLIAFGKAGAKVVVAARRDSEGEETVSQSLVVDGGYVAT